MNKNLNRLLILALFILLFIPLALIVPHFQNVYNTLEKYHVQGLWVCWLGAYALANLCSPMFMQGQMSSEDNENSGPLTIIKLYLSVMAITFIALGVIFFGLWCLGWLLQLVSLIVYIIVKSLVDFVVFLIESLVDSILGHVIN